MIFDYDPDQPDTCSHPLDRPDPDCPVCELFDDLVCDGILAATDLLDLDAILEEEEP